MPIHDWTRVKAGIFHHFHLQWISTLSNALNHGLLPPDYYALAEQIAGGLGPDVLTLERPAAGARTQGQPDHRGAVALEVSAPKVQFHARTEHEQYAAKAMAVVVRHSSNHEVVAMIEIVSPGNKDRQNSVRSFVDKAEEVLRAGVHLLIVDLFPPGPRDPNGIHRAIWDRFDESDPFEPPEGKPLTLAAYIGGPCPESFVEPTAVGTALVEMPLFLSTGWYVPVPLESTYQAAWEAVPEVWRKVLES